MTLPAESSVSTITTGYLDLSWQLPRSSSLFELLKLIDTSSYLVALSFGNWALNLAISPANAGLAGGGASSLGGPPMVEQPAAIIMTAPAAAIFRNGWFKLFSSVSVLLIHRT